MATEVILTKDRGALSPRDPWSAEQVDRIKAGVDVMAKLWVPRNLKQHRLAWALAKKVADNHPRLQSAEAVMMRAKMMAGLGTMTTAINPETGKPMFVFLPESLSFATMDQTAFVERWPRLLQAFADLLGVSPETLLAETGLTL